jgi:predicted ester cyclase
MSADHSTAVVNRMIKEIQNGKNIGLCEELFSADFVNHTPPPNFGNDRTAMQQLFAMVHAAFPDGRIAVEDQISDGRKVWTRKLFTGTHTGAFGRLAPTGNVVTYRVMDILTVENGKMTEHWSVLDRLDLFQQLGMFK